MLELNHAESLFNSLYSNINGYDISNAARRKSSIDTSRFLYGEIPFQTWKGIVELAKPKKDGVFFDLGSGTGRILMASHLLFNFKKLVGVELLEGLHEKAVEVKNNFDKTIKPQIADHISGQEFQLINGDIFQTDLREADFIFMNHPFKDGEIFLDLEAKFLKELKKGTKIVTIIRTLRNPSFKKICSQTYKFSWGDSTAHFFEV